MQYLNIDSIYPGHKGHIALPENIDEMIRIAETLASDFPFVRVDLYNVDGKIYFGELTFAPKQAKIDLTTSPGAHPAPGRMKRSL